MDDGHILVFSCLALNITDVPQGPLYEFLANNGAGPVLKKIEALNTGFACGVASSLFLVHLGFHSWIGHSGNRGLESLGRQVMGQRCLPYGRMASRPGKSFEIVVCETRQMGPVLRDRRGSKGCQCREWVTDGLLTYTPEQNILVFELIPAADGKYMPVRVT